MRAGPPGGVAPPRVRCQADRPGEASRGGIEEVSRMPDALAHVPVVVALAVDGCAGAEEGGVAPTAPGTATGAAPAPTTPAALSRAGAAQAGPRHPYRRRRHPCESRYFSRRRYFCAASLPFCCALSTFEAYFPPVAWSTLSPALSM